MRLLVVTARYPTPDRPAAGAFVRDRLGDPAVVARIVAPRTYDGSRWSRFARLTWEALTARGRFDGIEGHFILPTGPVALLAARLRRVPLVVYAHGTDVRHLSARSAIDRWLARRTVLSASAVVTNSVVTASDIRRLGREPVVVTPGVDLARFSPSPRPKERGRVLYVGGAHPLKGFDVARQLADTIVGPGLREIDPDDMPGLLAAHDVLLVPSAEEGFGVAAAEATAAGRWVVSATVGGLTETVIDGVTGTLVRNGAYADALASVPDYDPHEVASHAGRFDLVAHRAAMREVWAGVLAGASSGRAPAG
jgi:glycosyltransferase involved in cell wall biosynthesis